CCSATTRCCRGRSCCSRSRSCSSTSSPTSCTSSSIRGSPNEPYARQRVRGIVSSSVMIEAPTAPVSTRRGFVMRTLRHKPTAALGATILAIVALIALLAPWIAPYGLHEQVGPVYGPPSLKHPLGLDDGGIDMVTLLMWGVRISLVVGFAATFVSMVIGGTIGVSAGYFGGKVDTV